MAYATRNQPLPVPAWSRELSALWLAIMLLLAPPGVEAAWPAAETALTTGRTVPVLCYHRFGAYGPKDAYSLDTEEFARQLAIIADEGFVPVSLSQLAAGWEESQTLPEKPLLITVDDGYRDFLKQARPLLEARGYPAVLFIYTDFVGARLGLSRAELRELQAAGYDIGSHSASHPKLNKFLKGETREQRLTRLRRELAGSREKLRQWSGGEVIGLAYPYGLWDQMVAEQAQAAGYRLMFTVNPGPNRTGDEQICLKRNMVLRGTRDATFRAMLREQPLVITDWTPRKGEWMTGPVSFLEAVLDPASRPRIRPETLRAQRGSRPLSVTLDARTGRLRVRFSETGISGTHLVVITARAREGDQVYKNSRLIMIKPAETHTDR